MQTKNRQFRKAAIARCATLVASCLSVLCWLGTPGNACGLDQLKVNASVRNSKTSKDVVSAQLTADPSSRLVEQTNPVETSNLRRCVLAEELVLKAITSTYGSEVPTAEGVVLSLFD